MSHVDLISIPSYLPEEAQDRGYYAFRPKKKQSHEIIQVAFLCPQGQVSTDFATHCQPSKGAVI